MFKQRVITGILLFAITVAIILFVPTYGFLGLTIVLTLWVAWEWSQLIALTKRLFQMIYVLMTAILLVIAWFLPIIWVLSITVLVWFVIFLSILFYSKTQRWWFQNLWAKIVLGWIAMVPCWLALNVIRNAKDGIVTLIFLLCIVSAADTGAYLSGKWWGKARLIPTVSPQKTQVGFWGGIIFALFITFLGCVFLGLSIMQWPKMLIIGLLTVLFSIVGDLSESLLKRQAKVKDSGNYLPGHGGLLDRLDSLLAAVPVFLLMSLLLKP